jgi:biopolymer transport protein TolR
VGLRKTRYRKEAYAEVNMTNLIDIVMVLLIVFILVSNFVQTSLNIKVPEVSYAESSGKEKIIVEVNKSGEYSLNGVKKTEEQLKAELTTLREQMPDEGLFIRADELAAFGDVSQIMSLGTLVGFTDLKLPMRMKRDNK